MGSILWALNLHSHVIHAETRAHPYCVDVAIRKIASPEDDLLETDVRSGSSGMDATDSRGIFRGPSVEIAPEFARYRVNFSTAALAGLRTFLERAAFMCAVGDTLPVSRRRCTSCRNTRRLDDVDQDNAARIPLSLGAS
jgi:hypothetical protein